MFRSPFAFRHSYKTNVAHSLFKNEKAKHIKEILSQSHAHPFRFPIDKEKYPKSTGRSKDNADKMLFDLRSRENMEARARLSAFDTFLLLLEPQIKNYSINDHYPPVDDDVLADATHQLYPDFFEKTMESLMVQKLDTNHLQSNNSSKLDKEKKCPTTISNISPNVHKEIKGTDDNDNNDSNDNNNNNDDAQNPPPSKKKKLEITSQRNKNEMKSLIQSRLEENYVQKESVAKYETIKNLAAFDDFLCMVPQVKYCDIKDFSFLDDEFM